MKKYLMFPHGGSGNHGCEAIVRTTVNMMENKNITLFSSEINEDKKYSLQEAVKIVSPNKSITKFSFGYLKAIINSYIGHQTDAFDALYFEPVISTCDKETVLLSIGGDNYCYGENNYIYLVNRYARKQGARTVLWGCSVEPDDITEQMKEDLSKYDLITARESITYDALSKINKNTVLLPDPAFTLHKDKAILPDGLGKKPFVGINVSPIIQNREKNVGITMLNYRRLIQGILKESEDDIALIPHVTKNNNDDRKLLNELYSEFKTTGRIYLVQDQNCMQLKDVISKCRIFIGARTHATIAAYSTCVPTLVVGYSVKAKGIAKDLFGTYDHFVIPVQKMVNKDELLNAYRYISDRESDIKKHLAKIMPDYIEKARNAGKLLMGDRL